MLKFSSGVPLLQTNVNVFFGGNCGVFLLILRLGGHWPPPPPACLVTAEALVCARVLL